MRFLANLRNLNIEKLFLVGLVILSTLPRFLGLGYSHYYGDETKVLYLDKTVSALNFLLDQRKGPVQFIVAWTMEKLTNGYSEFWIRLPFAAAGTLSIIAFYFLVRKVFGKNTAILSSLLFAFSGFSIAFSRTAQYQSFVFLFGFSALLAFIYSQESQKRFLYVLSGILYGLAFLSHYDAIFIFIPALFFIKKQNIKSVLIYFLPVMALMIGLFYIPYFVKGFFVSNTLGYISRRFYGDIDTLPNNSAYTFIVYNPFFGYAFLLLVGFFLSLRYVSKKTAFIFIWFFVPKIIFDYLFKSPGTHILQYYIPLYILAGYGFNMFLLATSNPWKQKVYTGLISIFVLMQIIVSFYIYVPFLSRDYPWRKLSLGFIELMPARRNTQLFLYGFTYNRSWNEIAKYLYDVKARGFYTNDNSVVAKYYVSNINFTPDGSNFYPQYYVYIYDNQEFKYPTDEFLSKYKQAHRIEENGTPVAVIYKLAMQ